MFERHRADQRQKGDKPRPQVRPKERACVVQWQPGTGVGTSS